MLIAPLSFLVPRPSRLSLSLSLFFPTSSCPFSPPASLLIAPVSLYLVHRLSLSLPISSFSFAPPFSLLIAPFPFLAPRSSRLSLSLSPSSCPRSPFASLPLSLPTPLDPRPSHLPPHSLLVASCSFTPNPPYLSLTLTVTYHPRIPHPIIFLPSRMPTWSARSATSLLSHFCPHFHPRVFPRVLLSTLHPSHLTTLPVFLPPFSLPSLYLYRLSLTRLAYDTLSPP